MDVYPSYSNSLVDMLYEEIMHRSYDRYVEILKSMAMRSDMSKLVTYHSSA